MLLLEAGNIKKYYSDRLIIQFDELKIHTGDRIGIVGQNGSGKTTLLNILSGDIEPDKGFVKQYCDITYIRQFSDEGISASPKALKELELSEKVSQNVYSGGEKTRIKIANAFSSHTMLLFADEPTSNLDYRGIEVLIQRLSEVETFLLISHDRTLLDNFCNKIMEIENGKLKIYNGGYSSYKKQSEIEYQYAELEYEKYVAEKKKLEAAIRSRQRKSRSMKKAPRRMGTSEARLHTRLANEKREKIDNAVNSLKTRLEKLEIKEKPQEAPEIKLDFSLTDPPENKVVISAEDLSFSYGKKKIFHNASFKVYNKAKTAVWGENGTGKTTLLNLISSRSNGSIHIVPKARIGHFHPLIFGLGYLIPLDTSFGIVFAQVLERIIETTTIKFGWYSIRGIQQNWYQALNGGYVALALAAIIPARHVIKEIWVKAVYGIGEDDSEEGMSYRVSLFGLFAGLAVIALFFIFILKYTWWLALFFTLLGVNIGILAYARIRGKAGIPSVWSRFGLTQELVDFLGNTTGSGKISPHDAQITFSFTRIPGTSAIWTTGAFALETYELADKVNASRRDITKALVIAILFGYIIGMYFCMEYKFSVGTRKLAEWNQLSFAALGGTSHADVAKPAPVLGIAVVFWSLVTLFFSYMKMNFLWWPIDPVGFVAGTSLEFGGVFWFSIFLAWLVKMVILRYGGMQGWVRVIRPFFIGIILGYIVVTTIAAILGLQPAGYLGITTFK